MKGIPTANALKMSSGFTNESKKYHQRPTLKRAGGAVLIDIAELPNPNRRRRRVEAVTVVKKFIYENKRIGLQSNDAEKFSKDPKNKDKRTSTLKKQEQPQKALIVNDKEKEEKIVTEEEETVQNEDEYGGVEVQQKGKEYS